MALFPKTCRRGVRGITVLWAAWALSAACSDKATGRPEGMGPPGIARAVPVTVGTVARKVVPVHLQAIGNVQASATVSVRPQVGGKLLRVHFVEGQEVKEKSTLFTIDPLPLQAALRQAEAAVARDAAQLSQAEAALAQRNAEAKQAEANLRRDEAQFENARAQLARYAMLQKQQFVSADEFDKYRTNAAALEATVAADQAATVTTKAAIRAAQATVESARAAMRADQAAADNAKLQLGYCTIRAPLTGQAGNSVVHAGNIVKANDETPLVVILRIRPVNVVFSVPEQHLPEIQKARASGRVPVEARVTGDSGSPLRGELSFVQNTVDSSTGTIQIKASFENLDNRLWPGQYVNVIVMLSTQQDAVAAPFEAIQTGQKGTYVFVVKADRTVELRPVVVARTFGDQAVVERGLTPGEQVVTVGQLRLTPGAAVEIKGPAENAAARTAAR